MIGNLHLTKLDPKLEKRIRATVPGMANWSEPEPEKKCGKCAFWKDELKQKTARRCQKYSELMRGLRGPRVPSETTACKYFSPEGGNHHD
jgi:hypothetical protein